MTGIIEAHNCRADIIPNHIPIICDCVLIKSKPYERPVRNGAKNVYTRDSSPDVVKSRWTLLRQ